jgi:hypothetical protein
MAKYACFWRNTQRFITCYGAYLVNVGNEELPESGNVTILEECRLLDRLSLISYTLSAIFGSAQIVSSWDLCVLCRMSAVRKLKMRKQLLLVHLKPTKRDPVGGSLFILQ